MTQTRKFDTARIEFMLANFEESKLRLARRRRKIMTSVVSEKPDDTTAPFCTRLGNVEIQIDPIYMARRRSELARQKEFKIETLLKNADIVLSNLDASGRANLTQQANQIAYAFTHSKRQNPVHFLTAYFIEIPHPGEINKRFFAARWTEQFEAPELHVAYLNALCVHEAVMGWNDAEMPIRH